MSEENVLDAFIRPPCAQQSHNGMQQYTPAYSNSVVSNNCNTQGYNNMYDFAFGSQTMNRSQPACTPTSYTNYSDQLDTTNWIADPRAVADIERGLKFTDKIETIEITSKDLSPASCCSNIDLLIPDVYKTISKDMNFFYKSTNNDSQWYCNMNCNNQRYDYPSCSQVNSNNSFMTVEERSIKCTQKTSEYDSYSLKTYTYNNSDLVQYVDQYDKQIMDKTYIHETTNQMYNLQDLNQDNFYSQNQALCNDSLPFVDMDNLTQPLGDCSNDESDIIVEESEEEVTDYSEDLDRKYDYSTNCIVCNTMYNPVGNQFYILNSKSPLTMSSQRSVLEKLVGLVGALANKRIYLCSQCLSAVNTIDHLELKLQNTKTDFCVKYEKTCKENNLPKVVINEPLKVSKTRLHKKFKHFCGVHSFSCKLCKKLFSIKQLYRRHMNNHKLKNRFLCEKCGKSFTKINNFKLHLQSHNKVIEKSKKIEAFSCKICKKLLRTKSNLKEHENYCSGVMPYVCKHLNCDKKFATTTKLKNHIKLKHDQKFTAICSICNIGFIKLSDYKAHKITHSTEKKFCCTKCDKSYKTISNLNFHMKFHSDKLPFICEICNKGFMRKEYLESHVNNHKGLRNFSCSVCGKTFVSQKNLDSHVKYHHEDNIKKKICNICNKSITSRFEEHLRIHSNLKEFECHICKMKFNTKGTMYKHIKLKHV